MFTVRVDHDDDIRRVLGGLGLAVAPQVLALYREDTLIGAFVLYKYTGPNGSVHLNWIGFERGWFTRRIAKWLARHCFETLKCASVYGEVHASDKYVRKLNERLGFKLFAVLPEYYPGDDCALYRMTRDDAGRWLDG